MLIRIINNLSYISYIIQFLLGDYLLSIWYGPIPFRFMRWLNVFLELIISKWLILSEFYILCSLL
jgi:hypothetical protein